MTIKQQHEIALKRMMERHDRQRRALEKLHQSSQRNLCPARKRENFNDWAFLPDASGGNDSEFECQQCGAVFRRQHPQPKGDLTKS